MLRLISAAAVLLLALFALRACSGDPPVVPTGPSAGPADVDPPSVRATDLVAPEEASARDAGRAEADDGVLDTSEVPAPSDAEPGTVLFAGRVVDGEGAPVAGASIRVSRYQADSGGFGAVMVQFHELAALGVETDADGRFEVRAPSRAPSEVASEPAGPLHDFVGDRFQLVPVLTGHARHEGVIVDAPRTDLELVLPRAGGLEVTVANAAFELAERSYVLVSRAGEQRDIRHSTYGFQGGTMKRGGLEPGTYDVHIVGSLHRRPYLTVDAVRILADEVARDPRLMNLDLRQFVEPVRVTVLDEGGAPAPGVTVFAQVKSEGHGLETGPDGSVEFLVGEDGLTVLVQEEGYRRLRREGIRADTTLQLERPLELVVRRLPPLTSAVRVTVWGESRPVEQSAVTLGVDSAEATIPIDEPGEYGLVWSLAMPDVAGSTWYLSPSPPLPQAVVLEPSPDGAPQEVWLSIDPHELARLEAKAAELRKELERREGESDAELQERAVKTMLEALSMKGFR